MGVSTDDKGFKRRLAYSVVVIISTLCSCLKSFVDCILKCEDDLNLYAMRYYAFLSVS